MHPSDDELYPVYLYSLYLAQKQAEDKATKVMPIERPIAHDAVPNANTKNFEHRFAQRGKETPHKEASLDPSWDEETANKRADEYAKKYRDSLLHRYRSARTPAAAPATAKENDSKT